VTAPTRSDLDGAVPGESAEELYENAPCGYLSTLPDGTIVRLNGTFAGWTGMARQDLLDRCRFQDLLTMPGRIYYETHWDPLLRMQGYISEIAFELSPRNGASPVPILVSAMQKRDEKGVPLLNRITVFNATDRRGYERELLLERRRAERADRAKAELLAMIGHDMRSPLSAIATAVDLLDRTPSPEQQARYLRALRSSSMTLLGLANQILEYSRLEAGQASVEDAPFDAGAVVADTADAISGQAEKKGLVLRVDVAPDVPRILLGDARKIQQVLTNLGGNAVKFTSHGSVTLALRVMESDAESVRLEFSVVDTGIGIAGDRLDAVFDEFTQADDQIGKTYGGTGLGLTISRRVADLLGGTLSVESELGKGSTFRFQLRLRRG
jgi:signal transduction histidine kinase